MKDEKTPAEKRAQTILNKAKEKEADRLKMLKERDLANLREQQLGVPTIQRKVGDRVQYGAFTESVIKEILDDGKIYLISNVAVRMKYNEKVVEKNESYIGWHQAETYYSPEQLKNVKKLSYSNDIRINFGNTAISSLVHKYYAGTEMNPEYQRGDVWEQEDKVALIDSIYKNIDIGKFTMIVRPYNPDDSFHWEILDGKQRLQTIIDFVEGRFTYKGLLFRDMHPLDRGHFEGYNIMYGETEGLTLGQKCNYFLKLNTMGKPQSAEHLEKVKEIMKKCQKE